MPLNAINGMIDSTKAMEKVPRYGTFVPQRPMGLTYTLTGPTSGSNGVASTAFTVTLPTGFAYLRVTVTPADSGTGQAGVFAPTSLILTDDLRTGTFTYTPGSTGVKVISVSNVTDKDGGNLTNPATISYTSS